MNAIEQKMIMRLALCGESLSIRMLTLCNSHIELFKYINRCGEITARELSNDKGMTIQNASLTLSNLYKKGYLIKTAYSHSTGGLEYIYKVVDMSPASAKSK